MSRLFTQEHEWIDTQDGIATVGITDHAQSQLGELVFVELPQIGRTLAKGDTAAVVESVKAASDVFTPVSGEVVEVNDALVGDPARINSEAESGAWLFKLRLAGDSELAGLMDEKAYRDFAGTEGH
jgi:glycine cleavage system H protein